MWRMRSARRFSAGLPVRRLSPLRKRRGPRALACQFAQRARLRLRVVVERAVGPLAFIKMGSSTNLVPVGNAARLAHGGLTQDPEINASGAVRSAAPLEYEAGRVRAVPEYEVGRTLAAPQYEGGRVRAAPDYGVGRAKTHYEVGRVCVTTTANKGN